jgi:hypothetical protein
MLDYEPYDSEPVICLSEPFTYYPSPPEGSLLGDGSMRAVMSPKGGLPYIVEAYRVRSTTPFKPDEIGEK